MGRKAAELDRETWISLFEAALQRPGTELNEEWAWLLDQLKMAPEDYPAILEALRQGRWRTARNPRTYLKTVARREAFKEQLAAQKRDTLILMPTTANGEGASLEGTLDHIAYVRDSNEAVLGSDGVWHSGGGRDKDGYRYEEDDQGNPVESYRDHLLAKLPGSLKQSTPPSKEWIEALDFFNEGRTDYYHHAKPIVRVNWRQWARQAGLGTWETKVLRYRAAGVSRDAALARQPDEVSRKALQAAWRMFERSSRQLLAEVVKKSLR